MTPSYKGSVMKGFVVITCSLFLIVAGALWAMGRCDGFNSHDGNHEHGRSEIAHSNIHSTDLVHGYSSGDEPVIRCCPNSYKLALIVRSFQQIADPIFVGHLIFLSSSLSDPPHWPHTGRSGAKPPGPFTSGASLYLANSVLRI